jgi:molybdate-binding protein/DNA-binding transcriptional regulator YhcF (GntR family)
MYYRPDRDEPIYLDIANALKRQIALGELKPGSRLPSIRVYAGTLGVHPGTVARAYRELENDGVITSRAGGGSFVALPAASAGASEQRQRRLKDIAEKAIIEASGLGFGTDELATAFTLRLAEWREKRACSNQSTKKRFQIGPGIRFSGSHDLAVELLSVRFNSLHPGHGLTTRFTGSLAGLIALECGEADIAGIHLLDEETGQYNIPYVRRLMPNETVVAMNLMWRMQGLMVAPGNPKGVLGIADLRRPDIVFVNRQKGSGTRMLIDSKLNALGIQPEEVRGYEHEEITHIATASQVSRGAADAGFGAQSAASTAGIDFIPLFKESYDLITLKDVSERPGLAELHAMVASEVFRNILMSLPGYDVTDTGKKTVIQPNSQANKPLPS